MKGTNPITQGHRWQKRVKERLKKHEHEEGQWERLEDKKSEEINARDTRRKNQRRRPRRKSTRAPRPSSRRPTPAPTYGTRRDSTPRNSRRYAR